MNFKKTTLIIIASNFYQGTCLLPERCSDCLHEGAPAYSWLLLENAVQSAVSLVSADVTRKLNVLHDSE